MRFLVVLLESSLQRVKDRFWFMVFRPTKQKLWNSKVFMNLKIELNYLLFYKTITFMLHIQSPQKKPFKSFVHKAFYSYQETQGTLVCMKNRTSHTTAKPLHSFQCENYEFLIFFKLKFKKILLFLFDSGNSRKYTNML